MLAWQFDVAAFFILLVIFFMIRTDRLYSGRVGGAFTIFITLIIICTICDIVSRAPLTHIIGDKILPREIASYIYYLTHAAILPCYMVFIGMVTGTWFRFMKASKLYHAFFVLPFIANEILILLNPFTQIIFDYKTGEYARGPFVSVIYGIAFIYTAYTLGFLHFYRSHVDKKRLYSLLSLYPITIFTTLVQMIRPSHLLEMFSMALAAIIMLYFVVRPSEVMNPSLEARTLTAYRIDVPKYCMNYMQTSVFLVRILNSHSIVKHYGINKHNEVMAESIVRIRKVLASYNVKNHANVYYLYAGIIAVAIEDEVDDKPMSYDIQSALEKKIETENLEINPVVCVCDLNLHEDMKSPEELLRFTDVFEKSKEESGVIIYSELTDSQRIRYTFDVEKYITKAINEQSFSMYYQPIYSVKEHKFLSAEALIRLKDPEVGFISPAIFIPAAERSDAILKIGDMVIDQVFGFVNTARIFDVKYIEINVSPMQCMKEDFVKRLVEKFELYEVEKKSINIEITETATDFVTKRVDRSVAALHKEGIDFSIDDYGTGYSNLQRIMGMPVKIIKIDKTLIDKIGDAKGEEVLKHTVSMIKSIGAEVLAEGVETKEAADFCIENGFDYIQGYYYAKPMPEDEYLRFLKSKQFF